jgi:acyl-CoA thioester hydrolase
MVEQNAFSTPIDVRFRDLDAMGHVNNAVFFTYFEEGRLAFFISASPKEKFPGFDFILAHISCDYLKPVTIDDRLALQIRVEKIGGKSFTFDYTVLDRNETDVIYATGKSVQVCYDYEKGETVSLPGDLNRLLKRYLA